MRHMMSRFRLLFYGSVVFTFSYVLVLIYTSSEMVNINKLERNIITVPPLPTTQAVRTTKPTTTKKVQLIIVTRWRSGSSFTGELFNNNPEFAYFFEPLIGTVGSNSRIPFGEDHVSVLHNILWCNFTNTNYTWWQGQMPINCAKSNTFSKTILCEYFRVVMKPRNETSDVVEEACKSRQHVAIKTVRVPDIGYLKNIVSDSKLNVKVIHLVRDPRAVFFSRATTADVDDMYYNECDELENNLRYWKDPPDWLRGHHMLLRYEDLAEDPMGLTNKIYDFLGVDDSKTVRMWLKYNTNWNEVGQFSRTRDSKQAAHAWRTKIDYTAMVDVQRRCIVPLMMAGYRPITSQRDLKNMALPTLTKFPYPLMPNYTHVDDIWDDTEDSFDANDLLVNRRRNMLRSGQNN